MELCLPGWFMSPPLGQLWSDREKYRGQIKWGSGPSTYLSTDILSALPAEQRDLHYKHLKSIGLGSQETLSQSI